MVVTVVPSSRNIAALRTVREIRPDAISCSNCGDVGRTYFDYVTSSEERPPAFCNKSCWFAYELGAKLRKLSSIEEAPDAKEKSDTRRSDPKKPKRRSPVGKPPKGQGHLVAVS